MADAVITRVTILTRLRLELNDVGTAKWLTDDQYNERIYKHIVDNSNEFTFDVRVPGSDGASGLDRVWTFRSTRLWLLSATFTGIDDGTYNIVPEGSISETTATKKDTRSSITVTGTPINFPELVIDIIQTLMTHKAQKESINVGSAGFSPQDEDRLKRIAEKWRGIVAF